MSGKLAETIEAAREMGFDIPEQNRPRPTVIDALRVILAHETEMEYDKEFARWDWRMQKSRIEQVVKAGALSRKGEEKAHNFLKKYKLILNKYGIDYDNIYPLIRRPKSNKEEFPEEIQARAWDVLKSGNPVQYVADACGRMVLGAETAFKKLTCCISVQNIKQSSGLHPKLTGKSSGGKTWTIYTFAHHLPKEAVIKGSMSAKAGFYHDDGDRILRILDDYQAGNEDLDTVIKQTTSEFHEPYSHRTVVKQVAATLEIGSEQTWAITSVNNDQDIQVLNRGIPVNVDDSVELTRRVNARTVERYGMGEAAKPVDETVLVCRCIFQILRDEGYIDVRIPFWERIEWLDTSNRRNPSIFMDLVVAHTAMFRHQRVKDSKGYYLATEEDFQAAKGLFTDKDGEELVKRLTRRERDILELLVSNPGGLTRDDIAEKLDIAPQQVSRSMCGRDGQGGLLQKVTIKETKLSEMIRINEEQSRTVHKTVYSLKDYDKFAGFDAVVKLREANQQQEPSRNQRTHDETIDETISTASSSYNETKENKNKNKIEEERDRGDVSSSAPLASEKNGVFREEEKNGFVGFAKATDAEKDGFVNGSSTVSPCHHETIPMEKATYTGKNPPPTNQEKLRIIKPGGYRTQIPLPDTPCKWIDHLFNCGEIAEFQHWKAEDLIKRGIAERVT